MLFDIRINSVSLAMSFWPRETKAEINGTTQTEKLFHSKGICHQYEKAGLPWWLRGRDLPANEGDTGSTPRLGGCHMLWNNKAHVPQVLNLCSKVWEVQLLT